MKNGLSIPVAGDVVEFAFRREHDLVVIVELVRSHAGPGVEDRAHVVVPFLALVEAGANWASS